MKALAVALLAAGLSENPTAIELIKFALTGLLVVLISLSLLAVFCTAIGYGLRLFAPRPLPSRTAAAGENEPLDEIVAVIAAAVAETIGTPHRIVHIRGLAPEDLAWALEGRMQHHTSHKTSRGQR
jgi:Na+-transporting methylmalonyl-CoA/oxaloacetate decarboxylase gamma subunit